MTTEARTPAAVAILGAGTWGLTLACLLHRKGVPTTAWDAFPDYVRGLAEARRHPKLPDLVVPEDLKLTPNLEEAARAEMIVIVVASHAVREVCGQLRALSPDWRRQTLVICTKGIEQKTLLPMADVARDALGGDAGLALGVMSGPSHAEEVARERPTTVVAASADPAVAVRIQAMFMAPFLRVYTHDDVLGVEIGGALKNIIAIAAGACDGLGLGDNARAALITRGLAEIQRLGVAMGARAETFAGLTGVGDLIVTATSAHSRNYTFGRKLAAGLPAERALEEIGMVVEGVKTCDAAYALAQRHNVEMPITEEVHAVLYEGKSAQVAVRDLMLREPKPEFR